MDPRCHPPWLQSAPTSARPPRRPPRRPPPPPPPRRRCKRRRGRRHPAAARAPSWAIHRRRRRRRTTMARRPVSAAASAAGAAWAAGGAAADARRSRTRVTRPNGSERSAWRLALGFGALSRRRYTHRRGLAEPRAAAGSLDDGEAKVCRAGVRECKRGANTPCPRVRRSRRSAVCTIHNDQITSD